MSNYDVSLVYPKDKYHVILQNSTQRDDFYGLDELEYRKLKIILAKFDCKNNYKALPDKVKLNLNKFHWNSMKLCFEINQCQKVSVRLNRLEEIISDYVKDNYFQYLFW